MLTFGVSYAGPSAFQSRKERALLGLSVDENRQVRFKGKIKASSVFLFRTVLRALGEAIWSMDHWNDDGFYDILDPVITVHPDKIFLEAFTQDRSTHALVTLDRDLFEVKGEVRNGTSNIDFTSWLWSALGEMRSSRTTWLQIDASGLEVETTSAGGRFEKKVEVPESWVRGFLQVQSAAFLPGTRLNVKPVDLLSAIRFLRYSKPKMSPRALRYEFEPNQPARIVLEPWEQRFLLRDTVHHYETPKTTRVWGRKRLRLLEPVLPFAQSVDIFLTGRGMPSYYRVKLPGMEFTLGLTGRANADWSDSVHFHTAELESESSKIHPYLQENLSSGLSELQEKLNLDPAALNRGLFQLCRKGLVFYRPFQREVRYRELFTEELDEKRYFPPNHRAERAAAFLSENKVKLEDCQPRETRKIKRLPSPAGKVLKEIIYRDWCFQGSVECEDSVEVILDQADRVIFGRCGCSHFQDNLLSEGPCEHLLALRAAGLEHRQELPTSVDFSEEEAS